MGPGDVLLLSVGLAADATAVAAARGMTVPTISRRHVWRVALFFGGFQALMPLLGWLAGAQAGPFLMRWNHWVAFVLLTGIGAKMLWDARQACEAEPCGDRFGPWVMLVAAVATSIDALGVGFTLPLLDAPMLGSLFTIGITTAVLSVAGLYLGRRYGARLGRRVDVLGGLVLIALGTKILVGNWGA